MRTWCTPASSLSFRHCRKTVPCDMRARERRTAISPTVSREKAGRTALTYVLHRLYQGSPEEVVGALADVSDLESEQAEELEDRLRETG